jgi:hypothetical protein
MLTTSEGRRPVCLRCMSQDSRSHSMRAHINAFFMQMKATFHFCCLEFRYTMRNRLE